EGQSPPASDSRVGKSPFGSTPLMTWLRSMPALRALSAFILLVGGVYIVRTRGSAERERVWAGMARESAHQLGTPLSSIAGWIELLRETDPETTTVAAIDHMEADLERLKRVAHRFERIGRPPRQESVDLGELVDRVAAYFRARVPTLAQRVTVSSSHHGDLVIQGDSVLLEWALESLTKNAIDALAGRDGCVEISAESLPEGRVRVRVSDDGPGIPREIRNQIFDPGFSTKEKGWGIGLSLARRIVRDSH